MNGKKENDEGSYTDWQANSLELLENKGVKRRFG
jgi:hypothetical protein